MSAPVTLDDRLETLAKGEPSIDEAMDEAIHKFGPPEIMNTDQGSQFTPFAWTDRLRRSGVHIIDGRKRLFLSKSSAVLRINRLTVTETPGKTFAVLAGFCHI